MQVLASAPDDSLDDVRQKEAFYAELAQDDEYIKARLLADAWCAAFVWPNHPPSPDPFPHEEGRGEKSPSVFMGEGFRVGADLPLTDLLYRHLEHDPQAENIQTVRKKVVELTDRYGFFHWHVAFPDVFPVPDDLAGKSPSVAMGGDLEGGGAGWHGGFDVVLGNPPWERIKILEKEWFAQRDPEIAAARNAAARRKMIAELAESNPAMFAAFAADKRKAEGESHFIRMSGRFPLCGRGDVNTYTVFAETNRMLIGGSGRVGMICPSGIATDDTTKYFFQDLMKTQSLANFYDFENRQGIFDGVHRSYKFALLTMTGADVQSRESEFVFFALNVGDLEDKWRRFKLSAADIAMLNPNTGTMATFRSHKDANLTLQIYKASTILWDEKRHSNPWNVHLNSTMFHMSNDSQHFLEQPHPDSRALIEAKYIHQYDHRFGINDQDHSRETSCNEKRDPNFTVIPRYWVSRSIYDEKTRRYDPTVYLAYRKVARSTDARTLIATILCGHALGESAWMIIPDRNNVRYVMLTANLDSVPFDFAVRQKHGGMNVNFYVLKQLPVIPPHTYTRPLLDFITPRVLELTYTAWDLQPFARDLDYQGAPFVWCEERRFLMRCELDALYFHLYGIERDDVAYIMDTFPIVKRKDEAAHGEYRTKRVILEMFDQMAGLPKMLAPAPKEEHGKIAVPDVSLWVTPLDPPPADPRAAHDQP